MQAPIADFTPCGGQLLYPGKEAAFSRLRIPCKDVSFGEVYLNLWLPDHLEMWEVSC